MKLKIISGGTAFDTRVVNAETGEEVEGITAIRWEADAHSEFHAVITLERVAIEAVGEVVMPNEHSA